MAKCDGTTTDRKRSGGPKCEQRREAKDVKLSRDYRSDRQSKAGEKKIKLECRHHTSVPAPLGN